MHLLARYPGYIMDGGSFRHIPWFGDYSGSGGVGGEGEQYVGNTKKKKKKKKKCKKYRKIKGFLISTFFFFTIPTPYFLKMIMCI